MDAKELRDFSVEDLTARVKEWREELFRHRFKAQSSENRDTSVAKKTRQRIARALTIIRQKQMAAAPAKEKV